MFVQEWHSGNDLEKNECEWLRAAEKKSFEDSKSETKHYLQA